MKFNIKKSYVAVLLLIIVVFCLFSVSVLWDSAHYMSYVSIFEGVSDWKTWDIVRGPVFPIIIFLSNLILGKTNQGLIILTLLFYLFMLFTIGKILQKLLENEKNNKTKKTVIILMYLLIILNPIIFGYYHSLLTEFVALTISILMCYLSWIWIGVNFNENKKKSIIFILAFSIGTVLSWHLKQPYVTITFCPVLFAAIVSMLENKRKYNLLYRGATILFCLLSLLFSIMLWNKFLEYKDIDLNTDRNVTLNLGKQLIEGMNNYEVVDNKSYNIDYINDCIYLTEKEKNLVIKNLSKSNYYIINIRDLDEIIIDQDIIYIEDNKISSISAIKYISYNIFKHPILVLESYLSNYLAISNIYPKVTTDGVVYKVEKEIDLDYCHENCGVAEKIAFNDSNIFYMTDELYSRVIDYEQFNNSPYLLRGIIRAIYPFWIALYKIMLLALPFVFIATILVRTFKIKNKNINLAIILLGYSFSHIMLHVVTGAAIDRYASPTYITIMIGYIIIAYEIINKRKGKSD